MNEPKNPIFELCDRVRETSFALHRFLRHGHKEKIYENGLLHRLRKQGIAASQQQRLEVFDEDGTLLGDLEVDLLVGTALIVEVKAVRDLNSDHVAQLLGYLRAARIEHGLLINFGGPKLQVRKFALSKDLEHEPAPD
jgi:GxxExxY protein